MYNGQNKIISKSVVESFNMEIQLTIYIFVFVMLLSLNKNCSAMIADQFTPTALKGAINKGGDAMLKVGEAAEALAIQGIKQFAKSVETLGVTINTTTANLCGTTTEIINNGLIPGINNLSRDITQLAHGMSSDITKIVGGATKDINIIATHLTNDIKTAASSVSADVAKAIDKVSSDVTGSVNKAIGVIEAKSTDIIKALTNAGTSLDRFGARLDPNTFIKTLTLNAIGAPMAISGILLLYKAAASQQNKDNNTEQVKKTWQSYGKAIIIKCAPGTLLLAGGLGIVLKSNTLAAKL
jgi:hypothetical protein